MNHTAPHLGPMLADILAHPDDDTLRLIYADAIGESGDEARAEFIRCQVESHHRASTGEGSISRFESEADRLLRAHHAEWLPFLEPFRWQVETARCVSVCGPANGGRILFLRGFVAQVHCSQEDWLEHGPAIAIQQPLERVALVDRKPDQTRWSSCTSKTCVWPGHIFVDLFDVMEALIPAFTTVCGIEGNWIELHTDKAAYAALSIACIEWARRQEQAP